MRSRMLTERGGGDGQENRLNTVEEIPTVGCGGLLAGARAVEVVMFKAGFLESWALETPGLGEVEFLSLVWISYAPVAAG